MYKIFQNNIKQLNIGDAQGTLDSSFNIDLSYNVGKLSLAPRTRVTTNTLTDQGTSTNFVYFDGFWWTTSGLYVWKTSNPQATFAKDASGGLYISPNDCSDAVSDLTVFNDKLIISTQSRIAGKDANGAGTGGWNIAIDTGLSNNVVRPVTVYNNRLYWTRLPNTIVSCDTSYAISSTASASYNITFPSNYVITFIEPHSTGLYIGITTTDGTQGYVVNWNGETKNTPRYSHNIYAQGALASYIDNTSFYVMNSNAELLKFNGAGFTKVSRLPTKRNYLYNANATAGSTGNDRFIHPKGMSLIDGVLSMLINGSNNNGTQQENLPSGIWEFLEDKNTLYHKYSMSYMPQNGGVSPTDYGQVYLKSVGGMVETPDLPSYSNAQRGNFLAGASFYSNATTVGYGIFSDNYYDTEQKSGWFTTVQIRASHYQDMWNKIALLFTPKAGMNMVAKYRTNKLEPVVFTMTWTSTTTFTTTQTGLVDGDEITIVQGKGGGRVAHIVGTPTFSTPNFTVTLDEVITGVSGTAKAIVQKWKKIGIISNINNFFQEITINNPSTLIELKVAIVATGEVTIDELILDNKLNQ